MTKRNLLKLAGSSLLLSACGKQTDKVAGIQNVTKIEYGDECRLCGMLISNFPGPKGQLFERGYDQNMKFCSTRDMFAYWLDPEHSHNIQSAFVHDMAVTPWDLADGDRYINARTAIYVVGHNRRGALGPTLASFSDEAAARVFSDQFGGRLHLFDQLNLALVSSMMS
ncbi:nitrous oxide reductase accessory protein NosL [Motiliproteus sp. MSK22-1]|nr:nitrous oxide reductase accessory protein NosL [Motiliproteus sp. MSK22-1]